MVEITNRVIRIRYKHTKLMNERAENSPREESNKEIAKRSAETTILVKKVIENYLCFGMEIGMNERK